MAKILVIQKLCYYRWFIIISIIVFCQYMILAYTFRMSDNFETDSEGTEDLRKILSNNIREFRKELHLTQEQLAENADISLSYLADIEHCKTWISDKTMLKLAKALHKKPFELLTEEAAITEKADIHVISDIIYEEKKELVKTVSAICDKTIQKIMKIR